MKDRLDLAGGDEPLFVYRFANENDFSAALYEGGISGVAQEDNGKDNDNVNDNANTDEDPDKPPGISLEPA